MAEGDGLCSEAAARTFKSLTRLRDLNLSCCALERLHGAEDPARYINEAEMAKSPLLGLAGTLEALDISHNKLDCAGHALALVKLNRLKSLSIEGNPLVAADNGECRDLFMKLPALKSVNGRPYSHGKFLAAANNEGDSSAVDLAKTGEDSSTCSCIYGNPCLSAYSCRDFNHRFEVAKRARAKMQNI